MPRVCLHVSLARRSMFLSLLARPSRLNMFFFLFSLMGDKEFDALQITNRWGALEVQRPK